MAPSIPWRKPKKQQRALGVQCAGIGAYDGCVYIISMQCGGVKAVSKNGKGKAMEFDAFQTWLSDNPIGERMFQTLKGRSHFYARYDSHTQGIALRLSTGYQGQLQYNQIRRVFERYQAGTPSERNMTSFYCDPQWPETPSRILAPYIPAIIKVWIEEVGTCQ